MRVGLGYDVHKLVEGRDLILGGVKVPHTLGNKTVTEKLNKSVQICTGV